MGHIPIKLTPLPCVGPNNGFDPSLLRVNSSGILFQLSSDEMIEIESSNSLSLEKRIESVFTEFRAMQRNRRESEATP